MDFLAANFYFIPFFAVLAIGALCIIADQRDTARRAREYRALVEAATALRMAEAAKPWWKRKR